MINPESNGWVTDNWPIRILRSPRKQFSAVAPGREYEHLPLAVEGKSPEKDGKIHCISCVPISVWVVVLYIISTFIQPRQIPSCTVYIYDMITVYDGIDFVFRDTSIRWTGSLEVARRLTRVFSSQEVWPEVTDRSAIVDLSKKVALFLATVSFDGKILVAKLPVDAQNHVLSMVLKPQLTDMRCLPSSASFHWWLQCISYTKGDGPWPVISVSSKGGAQCWIMWSFSTFFGRHLISDFATRRRYPGPFTNSPLWWLLSSSDVSAGVAMLSSALHETCPFDIFQCSIQDPWILHQRYRQTAAPLF